MKQRKVTVTLELDTEETLKDLRSRAWWQWRFDPALTTVKQVAVNVIQPVKAALVLLAMLLSATATAAHAADFVGFGLDVTDAGRAVACSGAGLALYSLTGPEDVTEIARTPKDRYALKDCVFVGDMIFTAGSEVGKAGFFVTRFNLQLDELGPRVPVSFVSQSSASLAVDGTAVLAVGAGTPGEIVRIEANGVESRRVTRPVPVHAIARTATRLAIIAGTSPARIEYLDPLTLSTESTVALPDSSATGTVYLSGEGDHIAAFARFGYAVEGESVRTKSNTTNVAIRPFGDRVFVSTTTGIQESIWPALTGTSLNAPTARDMAIALGRLWSTDNATGFRFVKRLAAATPIPQFTPTSTPPTVAPTAPPSASPTAPSSAAELDCNQTTTAGGCFALTCCPQ